MAEVKELIRIPAISVAGSDRMSSTKKRPAL